MIVRFRVNPEVVRVSVRCVLNGYVATVAARNNPASQAVATGRTGESAVMQALQVAQGMQIPGLDLDMQKAYTHPWKHDSFSDRLLDEV